MIWICAFVVTRGSKDVEDQQVVFKIIIVAEKEVKVLQDTILCVDVVVGFSFLLDEERRCDNPAFFVHPATFDFPHHFPAVVLVQDPVNVILVSYARDAHGHAEHAVWFVVGPDLVYDGGQCVLAHSTAGRPRK